MLDSKSSKAVIFASEKGYKVVNGVVLNPKEKVVKGGERNGGYPCFGIRDWEGKPKTIMTHRLVAYQKYGEIALTRDVEVRHKDGDKKNNLDENILIGTAHQNQMDIPKELRLKRAIHAASFIKKHDHSKIVDFRKMGCTYTQLMSIFKIKSKGTLSFIINKSSVVTSACNG